MDAADLLRGRIVIEHDNRRTGKTKRMFDAAAKMVKAGKKVVLMTTRSAVECEECGKAPPCKATETVGVILDRLWLAGWERGNRKLRCPEHARR